MLSAGFPISPHCVCLAVADYNSGDAVGPPLAAALEDWPFDAFTVNVTGRFSRAGGFQALLNHGAVTTPADASIIQLMDADMVVYPGFTAQVMQHTRLHKSVFAPIVWSTDGVPGEPFTGYWRVEGTGMISFFV